MDLAISFYEQNIHHTEASLRLNTQYLIAQQYAYQSILVTSWFDSVARWAIFRQKITST